jgi:hypothetical protein
VLNAERRVALQSRILVMSGAAYPAIAVAVRELPNEAGFRWGAALCRRIHAGSD